MTVYGRLVCYGGGNPFGDDPPLLCGVVESCPRCAKRHVAALPGDFTPDGATPVRLACGLRTRFAVSEDAHAEAKREIMLFVGFNERREYERERMRQFMAERRFHESMEARKHYRGKKVVNS